MHPRNKAAMAGRSGAKCVPKVDVNTFHEMSSIGVRNIDIVQYYSILRSTASEIIHHLETVVFKEQRRRWEES